MLICELLISFCRNAVTRLLIVSPNLSLGNTITRAYWNLQLPFNYYLNVIAFLPVMVVNRHSPVCQLPIAYCLLIPFALPIAIFAFPLPIAYCILPAAIPLLQ